MLFRTIGLMLMLLVFAPAAWAADITVTVAQEPMVNGPALTLGDIAAVTGDEEAKVQALKALKLGAAPKPGARSVLTRELLGARLTATGANLAGITWNVPDSIVIYAKSQLVPGQRIADTALDALKKHLNIAADKLAVELTGYAGDIAAPTGQIELHAELPYGIRKTGTTLVNVAIVADGQTYDKVSLRYNVRIFEDIVVAARPIAAQELLSGANLTYRREDTARLTAGYATDIHKLTGLTAKKFIAPGTVIQDYLLAKPVMVKRGNNVMITARSGMMEVTAAGQALQDGTEGQLIRVKNTHSKRILTAKVVSEGLVEIVTIK